MSYNPLATQAAIWRLTETEVSLLEKTGKTAALIDLPLWHVETPTMILGHWSRLKNILFAAEDEDWGVWIDWYEAQLAGVDRASVNLALEEAILLIPDEIWKAGPKVANAEIRRLMQVHSRETLDTLVSPEPVIEGGKVTVAANAVADVPDDLVNILDLPERLGEAVGTLLEMLAIKANARPMVVPPLTRYRLHLETHGPRPMLDRLNDLHQIVRDEYLGLHNEAYFASERGLRRAFLTFFGLHKEFRSEFSKDATREAAIRMYRLDREALDAQVLAASIDAFEQGAKEAEEAGAATPDFVDYASELSEAMRDALRVPEPGPVIEVEPGDRLTERAPNEKLWTARILLKGGAFAGRLYRLLSDPTAIVGSAASILGFLDSERGKTFMRGIREIWEAIFGDQAD